jgi:hypothetical protein
LQQAELNAIQSLVFLTTAKNEVHLIEPPQNETANMPQIQPRIQGQGSSGSH